jgi:methionyl-tRNA formyltransferase
MDGILKEPFGHDDSIKATPQKAAHRKSKSLNIVIITQGVTHVVPPLLHSGHKILGIIESAPRKNPNSLKELAKFIYALVNRNYRNLKALATLHGIPYYCMSRGCDDDLAEWVKKLSPDLIVVHTMPQLLKPNIYSVPRLGTINLHQSYLPEYRGPSPDFWQYHDMVVNPGVTVHYIDDGADTGDIIYQARTHIPLGTKAPDRLAALVGQVGAALLLKAIDAISTATAPRISQPKISPTAKARKIAYEEHKTIIDWSKWEIERIWNLLRGTEQWLDAIEQPGGIYKGQRWNIEEYVRCDMTRYSPSRIYRRKGRYFVACRDGKIFLSKRISLKQFLSLLR